MICSIVTLLLRGVTDPVTRGRSSIHKLRVPFHKWSLLINDRPNQLHKSKGESSTVANHADHLSINFGIPHHAHFFVVITNVRSKRKEKKIFGDKGLRKKFQKTRDIDICRQEDRFEKSKWERQSKKIFYVEKFLGKKHKSAI